MSMPTPTRHPARWLALLAAASLSSCSCVGMVHEKRAARRHFEEAPTPEAMKLLLADDCFVVTGGLSAPPPRGTPMAVVAVMERGQGWEVAGQRVLMPGFDGFSLFLPARGTFDISATMAADGAAIVLPEIAFDLKAPRRSEVPVTVTVSRRAPFVESLADPIFDPEVGEIGVFHPGQWYRRTQEVFFGWGKEGHTGPGAAGDGTIALGSQLDPRVQFSTLRSYSYGKSHAGILENPEAKAKFLQVLDGLLSVR